MKTQKMILENASCIVTKIIPYNFYVDSIATLFKYDESFIHRSVEIWSNFPASKKADLYPGADHKGFIFTPLHAVLCFALLITYAEMIGKNLE